MISFSGHFENAKVVLNWSTATELNNDLFEIEKSRDGLTFGQIGAVKGSGTTSENVNYNFVDHFVVAGLSFYRLKQIDYDGQFEYSPTISVNHETLVGLDVSLAPNPTSLDNINVRILTDDGLPLSIELFDLSGKIFHNETIEANQLNQLVRIEPILDLRPGMYLLKVTQGTSESLQRISIK